MVYTPNSNEYKPLESLDESEDYRTISGTELRNILDKGDQIPEWFSYPEVVEELKKSRPPLNKQGIYHFSLGFLVLENLQLQMDY